MIGSNVALCKLYVAKKTHVRILLDTLVPVYFLLLLTPAGVDYISQCLMAESCPLTDRGHIFESNLVRPPDLAILIDYFVSTQYGLLDGPGRLLPCRSSDVSAPLVA